MVAFVTRPEPQLTAPDGESEENIARMEQFLNDAALIDGLIALDEGALDDDGIVKLFQGLVDTGLAWQLQGRIGRTATDLIEVGLVVQR